MSATTPEAEVDPREAELTRELVEARAESDALAICICAGVLGMHQLEQKRFAAAEESLREALKHGKEAGHLGYISAAANALGKALAGQEKYAAAEPFLQAALEFAQSTGHRDNFDEAAITLEICLEQQGKDEAVKALQALREQLFGASM